MDKKKKQICIWMTEEELAKLKRIREHLNRNSNSDTLRVLVTEADKKILANNSAMAV